MNISRIAALSGAAVLTLTIAACGSDASDSTAPASTDGATESAAFPVTVAACQDEVIFDKAPERAVLMKPAAVPFLAEIGVLDRVVARAGDYAREYYDDETWAQLEKIPALTGEKDTTGHLQISKEVIVAQDPDVVFGEAANLNFDTLNAVGVPLIEEPGLCSTPVGTPSFDAISARLKTFGEIFGKPDEAAAAATRLEQEVDAAIAKIAPGETRTAAVLYPTIGGGTPFAYGALSMAEPQLEAAGFTNVFGDTKDRVFEVSIEELTGRNPDVLILLHSGDDPAKVKAAITGLPGAEAISAIKNDDVLVQEFNFTEPATPLVVEGLTRIVDYFQP